MSSAATGRGSDRSGQDDGARADHVDGTGFIWRARLAAVVVLLAALAFRQAPGLIVPDTKLDLTADPGAFLLRALHIWDPQGALGQLQNQAYGYLFPVGPFHLVLLELGLPEWVVQRLWWTVVLSVAFLGMWRLSGALRMGTPWTRLLGSLLFALSPRMMSELAVTSVEVWPLAVAPWVLAPLVDRRERGWTWRISRSAVAVLCLGGVNAVASGAALVLPALWFATRTPVRRAVLPALAWLGAVVLTCLWWLVPLVLLGRFSPPFLDWIEDARVTTGLASTVNAVQGTSAWLNFLVGPSGPSWPAGWLLVTTPALILATAAVAALALAGLSRPDMPERVFLLVATVVGLALLTAGFAGSGHSPFDVQVRALLDGPLAPLRNTHKFELVLRVPLVLGLIHATTCIGRALAAPSRSRWVAAVPGWLTPVLSVALVLGATAPAVAAELPRQGAYQAIPGYWHEAARWLDGRSGPGSVLVEPAAAFADLRWGSPKDEPLQAIADRAFVVRDAVPLGSAGATRVLDEVEGRLGQGRGGEDLASLIGSLGVRYVLVRNDLTVAAQGSPPMAVHEALRESGLTVAAAFGPTVQSPVETPDLTVDERTLLAFRSLEVYEVRPAGARFVAASDVYTATAGPENLPELREVTGAGSAGLLGSDAGAAPGLADSGRHVLTDGNRRRETFFGAPTDNTSTTLTADDPGRLGRRALDYDSDPGAPRSVLAWSGIAGVTASSSASDAGATIRLGPGSSPAAAVDGDPTTRWVSGRYLSAVGEWLELDLGQARSLEGLRVRFSAAAPVTRRPTQVTVRTDTGTGTAVVVADGSAEPVIAPPGPTQRLRLQLSAVEAGGQPNGFAVAEIELPGLAADPVVAVPARPTTVRPAGPVVAGDAGAGAGVGVGAIVVRDERPGRSGCLHQDSRPLCSARFERADEEPRGLSRTFDLTARRTYTTSVTARARDGQALERLLEVPDSIRAEASSREVQAPEGRPGAAVDRDLGTGWIAAPTDETPTLDLFLPRTRTVSGLQLLRDDFLAASRPSQVDVRVGDGPSRRVSVDADGTVRLPATRGDRVRIDFVRSTPLVNIDAVSGFRSQRPVGVSEIRVLGADDLRRPVGRDREVSVPCGFAPTVRVDGRDLVTSLRTTVGAVLDRRDVQLEPCGLDAGRVDLGPGKHGLTVRATAELAPLTASLVDRDTFTGRLVGPGTSATLERDTPTSMRLSVPTRSTPGLLVVPQNFSAGWSAVDSDGRDLTAVRVDGWQQGWVLPAGGSTTVTAQFGADTAYRAALATGPLVAVLLGLTLLRGRRRRLLPAPAGTALAARTGPAVVGLILVGVALSLVGGWVGLAATVVGGAVAHLTGRLWAGWTRSAAAAALALSSGVVVAAQPWTGGAAATDSVLAQGLVLAGVVVAVGIASPAPSRSSRDEERRTS